MFTIRKFVKNHPVLAYFALVFAISWGGALVVLGPEVFLGTKEVSFVAEGPLAYLAFLGGPAVAGILIQVLANGRTGVRDLGSRLLRWRVGAHWYTVALLTAPLLTIARLGALSLTSPDFLPGIITADDKVSLLVPGIVVGLVVPIFEELGWTGFAIPELRKRYGILATGLMVGVVWGVWHFPLFAASASHSGAIPSVLYVAALLFAWLLPYRVLMVWVYDRTQSLLVAMLMHMPIVVDSFVLRSASISGVAVLTDLVLFGAELWVVVAAVAIANGMQLSEQRLRRRAA